MKLQNKFLVFLMPAGLLAAGLILFLIHRYVHSAVASDLEKNVLAVAKAAAQDSAPAFKTENESLLLPRLQVLQDREGALYAAALDPYGRVLAHTSIKEKGAVQDDPFARAALRSDQPSVGVAALAAGPILQVAVPVWTDPDPLRQDVFLFSGEPRSGRGVRLGLLEVGVPLEPALEIEERILRGISAIIAVIWLLGAGYVLLLVRGILTPVNGLLSGIAKIAQGRYGAAVPVVSTDELGTLARSFNSMSAELARTTVSKEYVEGVLENMIDLLVVADPDGRIETMNPAMLGALSYSAGEAAGLPLFTLFQEMPAAFRGKELRDLAESGAIRDLETALLTRSGRAIPVLFSASVFNGRDGRLRGIIGVAKDISERKRTEAALLAAKAAAEASSKELEAFSYSVAHDLRAPLRAVDGFSQVLLDRYGGGLDEEGKDFLRRVRGGSRRMGQLIDDLLNLSRITRSGMSMETVDLTALAGEIAAELKKSQPERKAEFVVAKGLTCKGDPNLLRIMLTNLLSNAWKYTGKKPSARIEFGAARREGVPAYFVRDDGAGFDMAFSKKLFKPFSRLHAAVEFEGTGIGLATVQRIAERHGGRAWGEGAPGKGAAFFFTLWEEKRHGPENDPAR